MLWRVCPNDKLQTPKQRLPLRTLRVPVLHVYFAGSPYYVVRQNRDARHSHEICVVGLGGDAWTARAHYALKQQLNRDNNELDGFP